MKDKEATLKQEIAHSHGVICHLKWKRTNLLNDFTPVDVALFHNKMNSLLERRDELNLQLKCKRRRGNPEPSGHGPLAPPVPAERD